MFIYEIVGWSHIASKDLFIVHLMFEDPRVHGKAVEVVFVKPEYVEGGKIDVGQLCRVYRNNKGFVSGIEIV